MAVLFTSVIFFFCKSCFSAASCQFFISISGSAIYRMSKTPRLLCHLTGVCMGGGGGGGGSLCRVHVIGGG